LFVANKSSASPWRRPLGSRLTRRPDSFKIAAAPVRGAGEGSLPSGETSATTAAEPYPPDRAWYAVGVLLLVTIVAYVDRLVMAFLVDPVKHSLALTDTQAGMLSGLAFAASFVIMGIPMGRLVDTRSRKAVLSAAIVVWSAMTVACGAAWNYLTLFIARMGVGVGEAALNPAAVSMISDMFTRDRVARPIGVFTLGIYIGGGLAILLGGQLLQLFSSMGSISLGPWQEIEGWRLVFLVTGLPGFLVAAMLYFTVREPARGGMSPGPVQASATLAEAIAYLRAHARLYTWLFGGFMAFGFYLYGATGWYPTFLMRTYDLAPADVSWSYGGIFLVAGIAGALLIGPATRLLQRRGHLEAPVLLCLGAMIVSTLPSILGPLMDSPGACLALFVVTMLCWSSTIGLAFACIALVTPASMRGLMTGILMVLMNATGGALGPVVVGALSDHVFGTDGIRYSLAALAAVTFPLAALLFALARPAYRETMSLRAA
jgi:MFS family permease